jgi:hypothetical protein
VNETPQKQPCPADDDDFALPSLAADSELAAAGWVRRNLADAARARESVELYESMGFEVKVRTLTPADFGPQCAHCASAACAACVLIYTRKKQP